MPASVFEEKLAGKKPKGKVEPHHPLRYQKRSLALLAVYLPFLIVPWILTCVLAVRPLGLLSYWNQAGQYSPGLYREMRFWARFVGVTDAIASVLTVPITSALLAHGAVAYCQRTNIKRSLNLRQTFTLADRGWADLSILWHALRPEADGSPNAKGMTSLYLWMAAAMILLSAIQTPLRQALIGNENITIMTCNDSPKYTPCNPYGTSASRVAKDPEPFGLKLVPQGLIIPRIIKNLATVSYQDTQTYLWHEPSDGTSPPPDNSLFWYYNNGYEGVYEGEYGSYFVSAVPNGTLTGVLREHAMRLNSSVSCNTILPDAYPSTCGGSLPFDTSFSREGQFDMEVCVPGDQGTSLWTLSRDRQDISEDMFIKVRIPPESDLMYQGADWVENFTVKCTANTTRGYFELGNVRNNLSTGLLLEQWPDKNDLRENFNDYLSDNIGTPVGVPSTVNTYPTDEDFGGSILMPLKTSERHAPGPLMLSGLALFGEGSMFSMAAKSTNQTYPPITRQVCQAGNIPFLNLDYLESEQQFEDIQSTCLFINSANEQSVGEVNVGIEHMLYELASVFFPDNMSKEFADRHLSIAMYFAIEAWLTQTATAAPTQYVRSIYTSPGLPISRPVKTLAATIVISALLFAQLLGLLLLVLYIYSVPTWTTALDSQAIAKLTKTAGDAIGDVGDDDENSSRNLKSVDGLVGLVAGYVPLNKLDPEQAEAGNVAKSSSSQIRLARGGNGVISRALVQHRPG